MILRNKRGSILDPIFGSAYILKIVITIIIAVTVWVYFNQAMTAAIAGTHSQAVLTPVLSALTSAYFSFDYVFPFLVGGLMVISFIFAYKSGANYVLGIISIIVWALAVLFGTLFTNVYISVTNSVPSVVTDFPIMDIIMINLRWVALGWIIVICMVLFRKNNQEDEASELSRRAYGQQ